MGGGAGDDLIINSRTVLPCGATLGFGSDRRLVEIRVPLHPEGNAYHRRRVALQEAEALLGHPLRLTYWHVGALEYVMAEPRLSEPRDSLSVFIPANENGASVVAGQ